MRLNLPKSKDQTLDKERLPAARFASRWPGDVGSAQVSDSADRRMTVADSDDLFL
jgi:hypothetical protein